MEYFLKAVDELTLKDIASTAQRLLSSPLTMASYGDGTYLMLNENLMISVYLHSYRKKIWLIR